MNEFKPMRPLLDRSGAWRLNPFYAEIHVLEGMLNNAKIPFEIRRNLDGWQILYPSDEHCVCSVIQNYASYGHEDQLLEIDGLVERSEQEVDWVLGWLNAKEVFKRIEKHWRKHGRKNNL